MKRRATVLCLILSVAGALLAGVPPELQAEETFVTIGGGDYTGVYFPTGLAMATLLNNRRHDYGIRATVEATKGTIFNINALMAGQLEFGLAQADNQYYAVNGMAAWETKGPQRELRAVCSLYRETVTLVAAEDAGIVSLADLKGKRVSLGSPSPSQRRIVIDTLQAVGLDPARDLIQVTTTASEAPALLEDHLIDAFFFVVGHPSESIRLALAGERKARMVPVSGPDIDRLVAKHSYYSTGLLHVQSLYPGTGAPDGEVATFGVLATLCTSAKIPDQVVYTLTKVIFENLAELRQQHPALSGLAREEMLKGLSAPLHAGALQYYREVGLQ